MYDRIIKLLGEENIKIFNNAKILLIGLGGVGGYVFESLIRTGFKDITIVDKDIFDITNLNRQILATKATLGKEKVAAAYSRAKEIDDTISIKTIKKYLQKEDITPSFLSGFDYVIDACDDVKVKLLLMKHANKYKLVSSMGTANKTDPSKLSITTLDKTSGDPLAKILRKKVKENRIRTKFKVVSSTEVPTKNKDKVLGTVCYMPGVAGLLCASYVINDITKWKY